jgi:Domain of unknown function (DUF4314)
MCAPRARRQAFAVKGDMMRSYMNEAELGDRVEVIRCYDAYTELRRARAAPTLIDQLGTVHIHWDDGRNLGLVPGQDEWRVLPDDSS